jgi:hypothetical protein
MTTALSKLLTSSRAVRAVLAISALLAAAPSAHAEQGAVLEFDIRREGSLIGRHKVSFTGDAARLTVDIAIDIKVDVAFITVYRYTHRSRETWADGRLVAISTTTDDDGDKTFVKARAEDDKLVVENITETYAVAAHTLPSSYWHDAMLTRSQMIDTQDGKLLTMKVAPPVEETIPVAGKSVAAKHYVVSGDLDIDLWYLPNGEWARLVFKAQSDKSTITYDRRTPADTTVIPPGMMAAIAKIANPVR